MSALPPMTELYRQHRRRALAIARRILRDSDEAEDVVQEVFTRLFSQNVRFDGKAAYTTWLHRILVNSSINSLRAKKRRDRLESPAGVSVDPEESAVSSERHEMFLEGLQHLSIARMLRLPEGTVRSALNRGRTRLMAHMAARASDEPDAEPAPA